MAAEARLHASALGAAILPLPLARPSAGVTSDFQHKTKMAAAASGECPDENASEAVGPAPLGTAPRVAEGTHARGIALTSSGDRAHRLLRVADGDIRVRPRTGERTFSCSARPAASGKVARSPPPGEPEAG